MANRKQHIISESGSQKKFGISVIFPCYNDAKSIEKLILDAGEPVVQIANDWEIIVVNDGSTDNSQRLLESLSKKISRLKIIHHDQNRGYGAALRSGFAAATKDLIFYTDGDGQYDPKELELLLPLMTSDTDFVNGIKLARHDPTYRIVIGNMYSLFIRWIFWLPIYDIDCDFRLIRNSIMKKLSLTCTTGAICVELVKSAQLAGARFRQVSVHHYERKFGKSQFFRPSRLLDTFKELFYLWWKLIVKPKFSNT